MVLYCLCFVSVSVTFHLMYVLIVLVRCRLLSGHLLGKSCPLGLCIMSIFNFSYFLFGFEGGLWILIASVPCHCLLVVFSLSIPTKTHMPMLA